MIIVASGRLRRPVTYWSITLFLVAGCLATLAGLDWLDEQELAALPGQPSGPPSGEVSLVIQVAERSLVLYNDGQVYKRYRVALGKPDTPTPIGEWNIVWKDYNWGTGFGTRWMGLNVPWGIYGIHGTNKPWTLGRLASHGCIRMRNRDIEELFEWVPIGTPVKITGRPVRVERVLKAKTSGADVVVLQLRLKELGFFHQRADGLFGPATEAAVRAFQAGNWLSETGAVDKETRRRLGL